MKRHLPYLLLIACVVVIAQQDAGANNGIRHLVNVLIQKVADAETELGAAAEQRRVLQQATQALSSDLGEASKNLLELQASTSGLSARLDDVEKVLSALPSKMVFVTSASYTGNLGGLGGADAKCQEAADDASLDGVYLAWLSVTQTRLIGEAVSSGPLHRFVRHHVPYVRPDGARVANHFGDLVDGQLINPVSVDEFGSTVFGDASAWSSTSANGAPLEGSPADQHTCGNWTADGFPASATFLAGIGATDPGWSSPAFSTFESCASPRRLICVEQ